jgi:UDP-N-acetylglucosamine acyltransferase
MARVHATAVVEDGARLGEDVAVGPFCRVGPEAVLESGVRLESHVVVHGRTRIGEGTRVFPFASIGHQPQDLKYAGEASELHIGKNNVIREYVTMNPGTAGGGLVTRVGDNGLFMAGAHVAHDCQLGNHVIMANGAMLGGHVSIGDFAILGGLSAVHQFVRIGPQAMIGGMSGVEHDIIPFASAMGNRARLSGLNLVGLKRRGFERDDIHRLRAAYRELFASGATLQQRLAAVAERYADCAPVMQVVEFLGQPSQRGVCLPAGGSDDDQ